MILLQLALFPASLVLVALLQQANPEIPAAIQALVPVLTIGINLIAAKTDFGKAFGKRNLTAVLSLPLAMLAVYLMGESLPVFPVWSGDILAFLAGLQLWALALWGIWLSFWKLQQGIYDLLAGQLDTPDGTAKRLRGWS